MKSIENVNQKLNELMFVRQIAMEKVSHDQKIKSSHDEYNLLSQSDRRRAVKKLWSGLTIELIHQKFDPNDYALENELRQHCTNYWIYSRLNAFHHSYLTGQDVQKVCAKYHYPLSSLRNYYRDVLKHLSTDRCYDYYQLSEERGHSMLGFYPEFK